MNTDPFAKARPGQLAAAQPAAPVQVSVPETLDPMPMVRAIWRSDHGNYWLAGYSAVMITDTSFFRNKNYHKLKINPTN